MLTHKLAWEEEHPIANALEQTYVHTYLVQIYTHIHSADIHSVLQEEPVSIHT